MYKVFKFKLDPSITFEVFKNIDTHGVLKSSNGSRIAALPIDLVSSDKNWELLPYDHESNIVFGVRGRF
jgi:hypothetical protein